MPALVYTSEAAFAAYLLLVLGRGVVTDLAVISADLEIVGQDAMLDYGVTSIADATDLKKLRAFGKWRVWEWAEAAFAAQYRMATDQETLDRQQKWDHAKGMRDAARAELDHLIELEIIAADADAGIDFAEMVLTPFNARERIYDQVLREGL